MDDEITMMSQLNTTFVSRFAMLSALTTSVFCAGCVGATVDAGADDEAIGVAEQEVDPCINGLRPLIETGDFNGDGKTDFIASHDGSTQWYFSNGNGTWNVAYSRSDLTFFNSKYTTGDFNGDGKSDVIITTSLGSFWYFSNGNGTWTVIRNRSDLTLGNVDFTTGDFNGDGKTDVIITTSSNSTWEFSGGTPFSWTTTTPYIRTDLYRAPVTSLANHRFYTGDFNGDGKTDLIIQTSLGSFWYFSNGDGTWTTPYTRTDLSINSGTKYTTGDFSGDGKSDVIITTSLGSFWYFSNGNGTWTTPYTRSDLTYSSRVQYIPADYNGDGKTDLIIQTALGSFWYLSVGNGTWTFPVTRNDVTTNSAGLWVPGDFSGDGKKDVFLATNDGAYVYFSAVVSGTYSVSLASTLPTDLSWLCN